MKFQPVALVASLVFVAQVLALPQDSSSTDIIPCEPFQSCLLQNV